MRAVIPGRDEMTGLFRKAGYELYEAGKEYALPFRSLHYSPIYRMKVEGKNPVKAKALIDANVEERNVLKAYFNDNGISDGLSFDKDLSSVIFDNGRVSALMLCERIPGGLIVEYILTSRDHPEYLIDCLRVMDRYISKKAEAKEGLMLSFATGHEKERNLVKRLSGGLMDPEEIIREYIAVKKIDAV